MASKMAKSSIFDRFWTRFGIKKTWFRYVFYSVSSTSAFLQREPLPESIFDDFGAIWDPQKRPKIDQNGRGTLTQCQVEGPKSIQNGSKGGPNARSRVRINKRSPFWSILGRKNAVSRPFWSILIDFGKVALTMGNGPFLKFKNRQIATVASIFLVETQSLW